jgi:hypoxanthine phosphoribosyltransferase
VIAKSNTVEWYVVLLGVTPLIAIIVGVFFVSARGRGPAAAEESYDISAKVAFLKGRLASARFQPDLIIGLSRGGLVVAARLSYELDLNPPTPTISMWPHSPNFDNPLNSFDLPQIYKMQRDGPDFEKRRAWNILIIDDACKSGRSLDFARRHVEQKLLGIRAQIRTAALEIETGTYRNPIEPDFFASAGVRSKDAWGDEEEP